MAKKKADQLKARVLDRLQTDLGIVRDSGWFWKELEMSDRCKIRECLSVVNRIIEKDRVK